MVKIAKVISGGQTGGDRGGLYAAESCKIPTGGTMPHGFRTEKGSEPDLADRFNLGCHSSWNYPPRTEQNVIDSDLTIIFGNDNSAGCKLTKKLCFKHNKKCVLVREFSQAEFVNLYRVLTEQMGENLVINVAGNRESSYPGIQEKTQRFLTRFFGYLEESTE